MSSGRVYNSRTGGFDPYDNSTGSFITPEEEERLFQEYDALLKEEYEEEEDIDAILEAVNKDLKAGKGWEPDEAKEDIMEITRRMF